MNTEVATGDTAAAAAIQGLTHPNRFLVACNHLWKRRGALTSAIKTNWVERLVLLTDSALFWFETGAIAGGTQHGRIELRHVRSMKLHQASNPVSATVDDLERHGPKYQLEVTHCMSDYTCVLGGTDAGVVQAWHDALERAVHAATTERSADRLSVSHEQRPSLSPTPSTPNLVPTPMGSGASPSLMRHELTGIIAMGILGKARQAMTGHMKTGLEHAGVLGHRDGIARDGWSKRVVVLTETAIYFYKSSAVSKKAEEEEEPSPTFKLGSTLRTGDFIWGREVGRMPLAMADVHSERAVDDGTTYVNITVTGGVGSFSPDSFVTMGLASVARAVERGSDRFKVLLRTPDEALAAEWLAVLRTACGRQRSHGIERLQAAIAQGDASLAANMAAGLASLTAAVPHRPRSGSFLRVSPRGSSSDSPEARDSFTGELPGFYMRDSSLTESIGSASHLSLRSASSRTVDVNARVHRPRGSYGSSAESTDDEVAEVQVVLHPPSERRMVKEQLAVAQQTIALQQSALRDAQAALAALGATEAAAAVAAALAAEPPPLKRVTTGTIVMNTPPSAQAPSTPAPAAPSPASSAARAEEAAAQAEAEASARAEAAAATAALEAAAKAEADAKAEEARAAEAAHADEWVEEDGKPKAGFSLQGVENGVTMNDGDGTKFDLRIGPDYKRHGKKAQSEMHTYHPMSIDVFKRKSNILFHVASKLTLPPPPDGKHTPNTTGLPRRIVVNCILPMEAPSLLGGGSDGACYQVVGVFGATAEALAAWQASGAASAKLFARFAQNAPEGVLPPSGDVDVKERLKLCPKVANMKDLGMGWLERYNGKPALLTKSGSVHRGDDYLEIGMNTFRFGLLTRKGISSMLGVVSRADLHAGLTLEGRDDAELPEQTLLACQVQGLDLVRLARDADDL